MLDIARSVVPQAKYTIALGTCAAYGGLPAAAPNPTGAKGVKDAIGVNTINITGCPPHPMNLVTCITSYLLNGQMPPLRTDGRPNFCHGSTIHSSCTVPHGRDAPGGTYEQIHNFLAVGEFPLNAAKSDHYMPSGVILNGNIFDVQSFDEASIAEHVAHSWYAGTTERHPIGGETQPTYIGLDVDDRYSWFKAPRSRRCCR